jgi:hypothetical protein
MRSKMRLDTHIEISVEIDWDYSPPQAQSHTDPAFDAELEITSVLHNGIEIVESLAPSALSELRDIAIEHKAKIADLGNEP